MPIRNVHSEAARRTLAAAESIYDRTVGTLADTEAIVVDARGMAKLTVVAGAGATVTVSRVDTIDAVANTGGNNDFTVAATELTATDVDWPFFRISAAGGSCRYALT